MWGAVWKWKMTAWAFLRRGDKNILRLIVMMVGKL